MQHSNPVVQDSLAFVSEVKQAIGSSAFNEFLRAMLEFQRGNGADLAGVVSHVNTALSSHPHLLERFQNFIPPQQS